MSERLKLAAGSLSVEVLPAVGGSIARFDRNGAHRRQPLLRGTDAPAPTVLDTGCFPLVPFANRIRGGRFLCDGQEVQLQPNMAGDASPLHGQGWLAPWQVEEASEAACTLVYTHEAGEWPWTYQARHHVALDAAGLSLTLRCRNLSATRMPCGLGFHPYYPCTPDTVLDTEVASAWTIDAAVLPVDNVPVTGRYDLHARRVCSQDLDNGFDGWSGTARIDWPGEEAALVLTSPDAGRFQLYSPTGGGLFVAEPVQNANAALNQPQEQWPALGITLLAPGEEHVLHARFEAVPSAAS